MTNIDPTRPSALDSKKTFKSLKDVAAHYNVSRYEIGKWKRQECPALKKAPYHLDAIEEWLHNQKGVSSTQKKPNKYKNIILILTIIMTVCTIVGTLLGIVGFLSNKSTKDPHLPFLNQTKTAEFTDAPGYKVLLLPFQSLEICSPKDARLEQTIKTRLLDISDSLNLRLQVIYDTTQSFPHSYDKARKIGSKKGADLTIWGDYYDYCNQNDEACLKYIILNNKTYGLPKKGKSKIESIKRLSNIMEGQLQQDIDFIIYWTLGLEASHRGNCEQAHIYLKNIIQNFPSKASESYFELGWCHALKNEHNVAIKYYSNAIAINPNFRNAYINRAASSREQGDLKGANADLNKVGEIEKRNGMTNSNLGILKENSPDSTSATNNFIKSMDIYKSVVETVSNPAIMGFRPLNNKGQIVNHDFNIDMKWHEKAAEAGNDEAMYSVGVRYENGQGVARNRHKALQWYTKAANEGNSDAMTNVGLFYSLGWGGVTMNSQKAITWHKKAALAGNATAMNRIGTMYYKGEGIDQNFTIALQWYTKAAKLGNASAMMNIGELYKRGLGVQKDTVKAKAYLKKGAELKDKTAKSKHIVSYRDIEQLEKLSH